MDEVLLTKALRQAFSHTKRNCGAERKHKSSRRGYGHILDLLSVSEGLSQGEIAEKLGVRPQSVSEAVTRMEGQGLLTKKKSSEDRRVTLVFLTDEGERHRSVIAEKRALRAKELFSVLSPEEKSTLLQLLEKINHSFAERKDQL